MVALEVGEVEGVDALFGVGEVGVDLEVVEVGDDQERRVEEVFAVVVELLVGGLKVLVRAFVFPGEVVTEPHVGKAIAAVNLGDMFLEGVALAVGIVVGGFGNAEDFAKFVEVGLLALAFLECCDLPKVDEFSERFAHEVSGRVYRG